MLAIAGIDLSLPMPDWSYGLITKEDPTLHQWSKWLGGNGVVILGSGLFGMVNAPRVPPQRIHHIFGKSEHALDDLVSSFGSQEAAFDAIQNAANAAAKAGKLTPNAKGVLPTGNFGNIINVGGFQVRLIGGRIVDGIVQISSASRKGL